MKSALLTLHFVLVVASYSPGVLCPGKKGHASLAPVYLESGATPRDRGPGSSFVFEVREAVRRSASYCLVDSIKDSVYVLSIGTLDADIGGVETAISAAVYTPSRYFITHWVQTCLKKDSEVCARDAIVNFDNAVQGLKAAAVPH
jgi:hypothetical protein